MVLISSSSAFSFPTPACSLQVVSFPASILTALRLILANCWKSSGLDRYCCKCFVRTLELSFYSTLQLAMQMVSWTLASLQRCQRSFKSLLSTLGGHTCSAHWGFPHACFQESNIGNIAVLCYLLLGETKRALEA